MFPALDAVREPPEPSRSGSLLWELVGDWRLMMVMPGSMVMQVAHPMVGAGVGEHSVFRTDPWGRLLHSWRSTLTLVYGGEAALAEGRRLQEVHRAIRGVDDRGRRYWALHPRAYAWVHLILFERLVTMSRLFEPPLSDPQRRRLYAEMLDLGQVLQIRPAALPPTEADYWSYLDRTTDEVLENHPTVHAFLEVLRESRIPPPRWPRRLERGVSSSGDGSARSGTSSRSARCRRGCASCSGCAGPTRRSGGCGRWARASRVRPHIPERWRYLPQAARARTIS